MAGGVRLPLAQLEAFRTQVNAFARVRLSPEQLIPAIALDGILPLADCTPPIISLMEKLEPFGRGNPQPRFLVEEVRLNAPPRRVGATGAHLQLTVAQGPHLVRCIAFGMGELEPQLQVGANLNLIVEPRVDYWEGRARVDLQIVDVARCDDQPLNRL